MEKKKTNNSFSLPSKKETMLLADIDGYWDIVVTSLQDICNSNESLSFDNLYGKQLNSIDKASQDDLNRLKEEVQDHKSNIETAKRLVGTSQQNLQTLITYLEKKASEGKGKSKKGTVSGKGAGKGTAKASANTRSSSKANSAQTGSKVSGKINNKSKKKQGRSYYTSKHNPSEPIYVGSDVAYKLKNRHFEEWIQCEVMKVIGDGIKFEIRDPEPDENNNPGQTFRANYKEVLLIPPVEDVPELNSYPYGTKVLARYPETTTFYPAIVVGERKGQVRLKFDGEEEVNKETEVERRLVLPFPEK